MLAFSMENTVLKISGIKSFKHIIELVVLEVGDSLTNIETLFISSSIIDDFGFLQEIKNLEKLVFLGCKSDCWDTLQGNDNTKILRLHNLKQGNQYLNNIDFISTFINIEYLYLNMLGIEKFPDVLRLNVLHTIVSSNRNLKDFTFLQGAPALNKFIGWAAVDNHRTPAEVFIPILKNPKLKAFQYSQMFNIENKKLNSYIKTHCPYLISPIDTTVGAFVNNDKTQEIIRRFF